MTPYATPLCRCGHPEADHYHYILNGRDTVRCRRCDPLNGITISGNVALQLTEYQEAMNRAADHPYQPEVEEQTE